MPARCAAPAYSNLHGKFAAIAYAATEVNRGIFFSAAIIMAGFMPLFTMSGIEGHISVRWHDLRVRDRRRLIATFTVSPASSR